MLNKRRQTEPVDVVECPVGTCFHVFNPTVRDKDTYLKFLVETDAAAKRPRPVLPPSKPLTQSLALAGLPVEPSQRSPSPPPVPSPASTPEARSCPKVRYASEAIALFSLANVPEGHGEVRTYQCNVCGKWHLTSREYDPSHIVEEELVTFGHEPHTVVVAAGRYPDGHVASLTLRHPKGYVRINAENFPQLASALAFVGAMPPSAKPQSSSVKVDRAGRVLQMLDGVEMTTGEISDELGISTVLTRPMLARMRKSCRIEYGTPVIRHGQTVPTWRLPERGTSAG